MLGAAALLTLAACGSSSTSSTSTTVSTTTVAPSTTGASTSTSTSTTPTTTTPTTAAETTAAPTTTATAAPPTTTGGSAAAPAWEQTFVEAAGQPGNTVVYADNPDGLAVGHPGQWLLVDTATDQTVTVAIDAPVIGVRPAAGNRFAVVTATPDGNAEVLAVTASGQVDSLGTITVDGASAADGKVPVAAAIGPTGDALYVNVVLASSAAVVAPASLARVQDGAVHPLPNPPVYGPITFTDAGALVLTVPPDSRAPAPKDNRFTSSDGGATWRAISIPSGSFTDPRILLGISEQAALAYDASAPSRLGVVDSNGAVTGEFAEPLEPNGWLVVAAPGDPNATLVGELSGTAVDVDRASGAPVGATRQLFGEAHGPVVDAWIGSDTAIHALALDPACEGQCSPKLIVDSAPADPSANVGGCSWRGTYQGGDGAMGTEYSTLSLTNTGSQSCPVPHVDGVTGTTADGQQATAHDDDDASGGLQPAPAQVRPGGSVQVVVATANDASLCDKPSAMVATLDIDIGASVHLTLPRPIETACNFSYTQPGIAQ